MFNLFKKKEEHNYFRAYILDGKFEGLEVLPGNGSINSLIESLGYATNQVHVIHTFDSDKIDCIGVKLFSCADSNQIIFALTKKNCRLKKADVYNVFKKIDWQLENSALDIEDALEEGIDRKNLSLDFLKTVIDLTETGKDLYESKKLGLFLSFDNDILTAFSSLGWDNKASRWLEDLNPNLFSKMLAEAEKYHKEEWNAMREVNMQCDCILDTPQAFQNEFLLEHRTNDGNINFYNLLVAHYSKECELDDFLFVNKGRYLEIESMIYLVGNHLFKFGLGSRLIDVVKKT